MGWFKKFPEVTPISHSELTKNYCAIHEHASPPNYSGCEKGDETCLDVIANYAEAKNIASTPYRLSHERLAKKYLVEGFSN